MIVLVVKVKTNLPEIELLKRAKAREPEFRALTGLIQKYYIKTGPGQYGGVYVWDSVVSMKAYRESNLAKTIALAYEAIEAPSIEVMDVLFPLRDSHVV